jgi:erythromycin esterase
MKQQSTALVRGRAITLVMLLLIGLASQSGCRPREAGKDETASANSPNEAGSDAAEAARRWVSTNAIRLETVEAGHGFADLQPLKQIIGPARIVALGEATHGTREFFQLKHRMLEFLVTKMGFNVFAIEATMPESFDINDYVLTGRGDPEKALAGIYFWTWDTEEVRTLLEWMRNYNADPRHLRKVKFYGFDMQFAPRAAKVTWTYLHKVDPPQAAKAEKTLALLASPYTDAGFDMLPQDQKNAAATTIQAVLSGFDRRKADYIRRSSADDWAFARQHARVLGQDIELRSRGVSVRDRAMAENIRWLMEREGPDAKAVVWAHNDHVATDEGAMGSYLRRIYGTKMVVFGFTFDRGGFLSREGPVQTKGGLRSFEVGPAPAGSLEALLAAADLQIAAIDLRTLPKRGPVAEWFAVPHATRDIGNFFFEQGSGLVQECVPQIYDGLLFVEKTTPARPLSSREPLRKLPAPANTDFEEGEIGQPPVGWQLSPNLSGYDFQVITTDDTPYTGQRCALLSRLPGRHYGETVGSLSQQLDAKPYRGKRIKLQAATRGAVVGSESHAWLRLVITRRTAFIVDPGKSVFDTLEQYPVNTPAWDRREIIADVAADATSISYGIYLLGDGKVWLDSVSLEVVEK